MKRIALAAAALVPLAACHTLPEDVVCPAIAEAAITVTAQDSVTGAVITPGATAIARDGAYVDSATAQPQFTSIGLAYEHPGTFEVTVRHAGYQTWTKSGIEVKRGVCNVEGVSLVARLVPTP